jgi:hypothetical protein
MGNRVEVQVYPQRKEGDYETALMRFPDGFGEGGSEAPVYFKGQTGLVGPIPNDDSPFIDISFDGTVDRIQGMSFEDHVDFGRRLVTPAGVYVAKMTTQWSGYLEVPTEGAANVQLIHNDDVSGMNNFVVQHETNSLHAPPDFYGDDAFQPWGGGEKFGLGITVADGHFRLEASQNTNAPDDLFVNISLIIAKL